MVLHYQTHTPSTKNSRYDIKNGENISLKSNCRNVKPKKSKGIFAIQPTTQTPAILHRFRTWTNGEKMENGMYKEKKSAQTNESVEAIKQHQKKKNSDLTRQ